MHKKHTRTMPSKLYFSPLVALVLGLNAAIIVERLRFWLGRSTNVHDGKVWVFNSYGGWHEEFPFLSERTIKAVILKLENDRIVESTQRHGRGRVKWYRVREEVLAALTGGDNPSPPPPSAGGGASSGGGARASSPGSPRTHAPGEDISVDLPVLRERTEFARSIGHSHAPSAGNAASLNGPDFVSSTDLPDDVEAAAALIPEGERTGWLDLAEQRLGSGSAPWLADFKPGVLALAIELRERSLKGEIA